jgi:2-polyprenyl-3-methyl-5-hydroxy-6-metoxy-1,4-benzoquinol methylase
VDAEYGARYRELYERHWWWRARERVVLATLREHGAGRLRSILDVGCGDGLLFDAALTLPGVEHIEGVEPDVALLNPAGKHRARIHAGPLDDSFTPARSFSAVLFLDVLEHLQNPEAALRRAKALLEPDGFILVTVPAFMSLWTRHDELNHHVTRYTRGTLAELARVSGLSIVEARYLFQWTAAAKVVTRAVEALIPGEPEPPRVPPSPINGALYFLTRLEETLLRPLGPPAGSSLLAVLRPSAPGARRAP